MFELAYIIPWDDYDLILGPWDKDPKVFQLYTNTIHLVHEAYFIKVDEAYMLLYDGHRGLGMSLNTDLHRRYDNERI